MPRRNRPVQRRRRMVVIYEDPQPSAHQLAARLVERGLRSAAILGPIPSKAPRPDLGGDAA